VINLEREMNKRELLSLSYYSIGIIQHMVMDVVIGKVLTAVSKKNENKIKIADLEEQVNLLAHIFRNEYNDRLPNQTVHSRIDALMQFDEVAFNKQTGLIEIKAKPETSFLLNYFTQTSHFVFDAYLIALFALEHICEANHVINETRLVHELHVATIKMYDDNLVKELPSCLKELFVTALRRFNAIELADIKHYTALNGSSISFVSCPFSRLRKIEELKGKINELQQFNEHELQVIADRTQQAIKHSIVQHMIAKL